MINYTIKHNQLIVNIFNQEFQQTLLMLLKINMNQFKRQEQQQISLHLHLTEEQEYSNGCIFQSKHLHLHFRKIVAIVFVIRFTNSLSVYALLRRSSSTLSLKEIRLRFSQSRSTWLFSSLSQLHSRFFPIFSLEQSLIWNILLLALKFC